MEKQRTPDNFKTVREAAVLLNTTEGTLRNLIAQQKVRAVKVGGYHVYVTLEEIARVNAEKTKVEPVLPPQAKE